MKLIIGSSKFAYFDVLDVLITASDVWHGCDLQRLKASDVVALYMLGAVVVVVV